MTDLIIIFFLVDFDVVFDLLNNRINRRLFIGAVFDFFRFIRPNEFRVALLKLNFLFWFQRSVFHVHLRCIVR